MGLFWDWAQDQRIEEGQAGLAALREEASTLEDRCALLEQRVRRLSRLSQAMWELLREKLGLTEQELLAWEASMDPRREPVEVELYGPPPPPPVVLCSNCNTRFQAFEPICPSCRCSVPIP